MQAFRCASFNEFQQLFLYDFSVYNLHLSVYHLIIDTCFWLLIKHYCN